MAMANMADIAMIKKKRRVIKQIINLLKNSNLYIHILNIILIINCCNTYHGTSKKLFRPATPASINIEAKVNMTK